MSAKHRCKRDGSQKRTSSGRFPQRSQASVPSRVSLLAGIYAHRDCGDSASRRREGYLQSTNTTISTPFRPIFSTRGSVKILRAQRSASAVADRLERLRPALSRRLRISDDLGGAGPSPRFILRRRFHGRTCRPSEVVVGACRGAVARADGSRSGARPARRPRSRRPRCRAGASGRSPRTPRR